MASAALTSSTPFRGVVDYHYSQSGATSLDYHVVKVDLTDPGIHFATTAANGSGVVGQTTRQTTRDFVQQTGAQIGINANFFDNSDRASSITTLVTLAVSAGQHVAPWQGGTEGINFASNNVATIIKPNPSGTTGYESLPSIPLYNAISGLGPLVEGGVEVAQGATASDPRTAIGLDGDGKLMLVVVDGRFATHSDGVTLQGLADLVFAYGAVEAFNLDGGGSSTLVYASPTPQVINVPVGGLLGLPYTERTNGNNLAIFAAAVPEPSAIGAVAVFALGFCRRARGRRSSIRRSS